RRRRQGSRYARVRELSKLPCARATTVLGLEHFRATADSGVLALSFVTTAMRVCGNFPNSPARAITVLGLEHFRATADGGVLALSFVTALLARPWKVGASALGKSDPVVLGFK